METVEQRKPFTSRWIYATVGYTAMLVIPFYGYSNWGWAFPNAPLLLSPIFVSLGFLAIYTGEVVVSWVHRGNSVYSRNSNSVMYWLWVTMPLSIGLFMFLAGIGVIGQ